MQLTIKGILTVAAVVGLTAQAVTWDGGGGDGLWTTAANWNPNGVPEAGDTVGILNGDTVNVDGVSDLPSGMAINLSGGSSVTNPGVFRLNGSIWTNGPGTALTGDFWDLINATMTFENGSSASMNNWEQKGNNSFTFKLGPSGFSTLTPGALRLGGGATMANAAYIVDLQNYTGGTGTVVLVDFSSNAAGVNEVNFLDSTRTILNPGAFTNSSITFDVANTDIVLNILDALPPPVTWDNDSGDGSWTTASNWDPDGVPAAGDDVLVESGGTVTNGQNGFSTLSIESGAFISFSANLLPGNSIMNAGIVDVDGVWRLQGGTVSLADTGSLGPGLSFLDAENGTLNAADGASFANTNMNVEIKGTPTLGFILSETGFATLQAGGLYNGISGGSITATWENVTFDINVTDYDTGNGTSVVLMDFANVVWIGNDQVFDPAVKIEGGSGTLSFDPVEAQIVLQLYDVVTWDDGGSGSLFSTPENWVGDVAPVSGSSSVLFDVGVSPNTAYLQSAYTIGTSQIMTSAGDNAFIRIGNNADLTIATGGTLDFTTGGNGGLFEDGGNGGSLVTIEPGALVRVNDYKNVDACTNKFIASESGVTTFYVKGDNAFTPDGTLIVDVGAYNAVNGTDLVLFDYAGSLGGAGVFDAEIVLNGSGTISYNVDIGGGRKGIVLSVPAVLTAQGTPYDWLADYYDDLVTAPDFETRDLEDTDLDGHVSWQEYQAGTDPTNSASILNMSSVEEITPGQFEISWQGVNGKSYALLSRPDLITGWSTVQTGIAGVEPETVVTTSVATAEAFFQVEVE